MPDRTHDRTGRDQIQRVEELLAGVHDLVASLQKLGTELEHEVAHALYGDDGTVGASVQSRLELENARLARALEDRAVIEQAKGMIVAGRGGTTGEAFAMLTAISRRERRSVHDVAAGVVRAGARAGDRFSEQHRSHGSSDASSAASPDTAPEPDVPDGADGAEEDPAAETSVPPDVFDLSDLPAGSRWRLSSPGHASSSTPRRSPLRYRTSH